MFWKQKVVWFVVEGASEGQRGRLKNEENKVNNWLYFRRGRGIRSYLLAESQTFWNRCRCCSEEICRICLRWMWNILENSHY